MKSTQIREMSFVRYLINLFLISIDILIINSYLQQCGKGFKTMNCLRNHKRTHLSERILYGCDQCEKKYTQKVQLKKHIEIVHMNRRDFNVSIGRCALIASFINFCYFFFFFVIYSVRYVEHHLAQRVSSKCTCYLIVI